MNSERIKYFRKLLVEKVAQLLGTTEETVNEMSRGDGAYPDPVDRAMSESNRAIELRKRDRDRKFIQKIFEAIKKTEDGSYGVCEECGDDISEERLKARPETSHCIGCKEEQERMERRFGL